MSDKERNKKDGQSQDKKNQRMRESVNARKTENLSERARQKHEAKMTNSIPEGEARRRKN